jgi:hypothetical protein
MAPATARAWFKSKHPLAGQPSGDSPTVVHMLVFASAESVAGITAAATLLGATGLALVTVHTNSRRLTEEGKRQERELAAETERQAASLAHVRELADLDDLRKLLDDVTATLVLALEIIGKDLHDLYQRGDDTISRLINQAIFNALFVCDETITRPSWPSRSPGYAPSTTQYAKSPAWPSQARPGQRRPRRAQRRQRPDPWRDREPLDVGSISKVLMGRAGIEPATLGLRGPCSAG